MSRLHTVCLNYEPIHRTASSSGTWELRSIVLKQASRGETAALDPSVLRQTEA
jgi:hypothetical protein